MRESGKGVAPPPPFLQLPRGSGSITNTTKKGGGGGVQTKPKNNEKQY
jgi:hypothetical protein